MRMFCSANFWAKSPRTWRILAKPRHHTFNVWELRSSCFDVCADRNNGWSAKLYLSCKSPSAAKITELDVATANEHAMRRIASERWLRSVSMRKFLATEFVQYCLTKLWPILHSPFVKLAVSKCKARHVGNGVVPNKCSASTEVTKG